MGLIDEVATEALVGVTDLFSFLHPLISGTHSLPYTFLADPKAYADFCRTSKEVLPSSPVSEVKSLGWWTKNRSKFWNPYCGIKNLTHSPWDRQEPFRMEAPERVGIYLPTPLLKVSCEVPEIFLFPSGWSTTLWFTITGPLQLKKLQIWLRAIMVEPNIFFKATPDKRVPLDTIMNAIHERVKRSLYQQSSLPKPRFIFRKRVIAIIKRENANFEGEYPAEDKRVLYGSLEPDPTHHPPIWEMEERKILVKQFSGHVLSRFDRGIFLDIRHDTANRIRCFTKNLQAMQLMGGILQSTIKYGFPALPAKKAGLTQFSPDQRTRFRRLHRLIARGQEILRVMPDEYGPKICKFYWAAHEDIKQALDQAIPEL
jgi:hypothetical protein